jgi:hypothetical protein
MALSVNWPGKVITVPQADLTLVAPGQYTLNLNQFRLELRDIEDGEGIPFDITHNHVAPFSFAGITLARVVEIINGYTITFEDGQYSVTLTGANSNVADVVNRNQVSLYTNNTAGLVESGVSGLTAQESADLASATANAATARLYAEELRRRFGLEPGTPLTETPTSAVAGDVDLAISESGGNVTVTRQ